VTQSGDEPTLVDQPLPSGSTAPPPLAPGDASPSEHTQGSLETLTTSNAVVEEQEAKNRALVWMGLFGGIVAAIALQIPKDRAPGYAAATASVILIAVVAVIVLLTSRNVPPAKLAGRHFVMSLIVVCAVLINTYHVGVFSPVPMVLLFGIYFFGLGDSPIRAWSVFVLAAGGYLLLGVLAIAGVIDVRHSMTPLSHMEPYGLGALTAFLFMMLAMTFWLARLSRRATLRAMFQLETARRQVHQRQALLHEAHADLDRALRAPGAGRLSGQILGSYAVESVIGRGATGEVYAGQDTRDQRPVAIKVLYPHVAENQSSCQRFLREASISGALNSPHIVRVYDSGTAPDGSPYLVMEKLVGRDLATQLRATPRFGKRGALDLLTQIAAGLAAARDAGVVHRDLKPQNLFCVNGGTWKVLDFGVSRIDGSSTTLTRDGVVGTPSYMAPEQARGEEVDHRVDVFALGVIAYRVLTARPPFTGEDAFATMYNVSYRQPQRPSDHAPLDPDVDLVLALVLAKDKNRRFASALTFVAALRDAFRGELDTRLRADATRLLASEPWGADLGARRAVG
jgi:serine/threonine-protein kinase